jgi:chorismate synthase
MASNTFGTLLRLTTFGESHGPALGAVIDGCPPSIPLTEEDFLPELRRRRPGQSAVTTSRSEEDRPVILSGVFEGKTTGMPIAVIVENKAQRSQDYAKLKALFRPGHADEALQVKYGIRDYRGGGRSSGRETVARVIGGVIARKILPKNVEIIGHTVNIGGIETASFDPKIIEKNPVRCADASAAKKMEKLVLSLKAKGDSIGGIISVVIRNVPASLGDPVFGKLKARFADAVMSIGAVTGFSYGAGFDVASLKGSEYVSSPEYFGGILGGISTGEDIVLSVGVKPPSSVGNIAKEGRHDPCIVPRVIPVVEAMVALVLADCYLLQKANSY